MTIDVHAHAFPRDLAERAIDTLNAEIPEHAHAVLDGTVEGLLRSMDDAGIRTAVLCNIATRPKQSQAIIRWSLQIAGERIIPLGSVHPAAEDPAADVERVAEAGLKGIKIHALYQDFFIDDRDRMWPIYEAVAANDLVLTFHAGRDIAFPPDDDRAAPGRILAVHRAFPDLKIVAGHMGGWKDWEAVAAVLAGTGVYLETSYSFSLGDPQVMERIVERHPVERVLFGTDTPWRDQADTLRLVKAVYTDQADRRRVLHENAARLYGLE